MREVIATASAESVAVLAAVLDERREARAARPAFRASESVGIDHAVNYGVDCGPHQLFFINSENHR